MGTGGFSALDQEVVKSGGGNLWGYIRHLSQLKPGELGFNAVNGRSGIRQNVAYRLEAIFRKLGKPVFFLPMPCFRLRSLYFRVTLTLGGPELFYG